MLQRKQGTILTISSMAGIYGFAGEAVYCATKFAQVGFAQALDKELRIHGIKVGVIFPGGVKTEFASWGGRMEGGVRPAFTVGCSPLLFWSRPSPIWIFRLPGTTPHPLIREFLGFF